MTPREIAALVGEALGAVGAPYFVTGSVASMWYGEARLTLDVDVVVDLKSGQVAAFAARFPSGEFHCDETSLLNMAQLGGSANIIHLGSTIKADLIRLSALRFQQEALARARPVEILPGRSVVMSSAEDVIINKLLFYDEGKSDKHLRDIAGMLRAQGPAIDRAYIDLWAERFDINHHWRAVQQRADQR